MKPRYFSWIGAAAVLVAVVWVQLWAQAPSLVIGTIPCTSTDGKSHSLFRLPSGQCLAGESITVGPRFATIADGIRTSLLKDLPTPCSAGWQRFVTDASTSTGQLPIYMCDGLGRWNPIAFQADGTGYLVVNCPSPGFCLIGPNTAVVPSLPGPNTWTGANDFSQATSFRVPGN